MISIISLRSYLICPYYYYEYNTVSKEYDKRSGTGASTVELTDTYSRWTTMLYNF